MRSWWHSGDRKRELVEFARRRRFDRAFREALARRFGEAPEVDEKQFINFLDFFVLQQRLPDGRTVVEHFVAEHPGLSEEERAMLLGWREVVEGIFRPGPIQPRAFRPCVDAARDVPDHPPGPDR